MIIKYYKSQSAIYPALIDTTSSKTVIYLRKNVVKKRVENKITGKTHTVYEYEEAKLTKAEYEQYKEELKIQSAMELSDEVKALKQENANLQSQVELLTGCILELSEVLYV